MMDESKKATILVVDDDFTHRHMLETIMKGWGYHVESAEDGSEAVEIIRSRPFDLVIMDVRMATTDGIEALGKIKDYNPAIPALIMTAYSSIESAVQALKAGAYDYLTEPIDFDALKLSVERALEHTKLKEENLALKERLRTRVSLSIIGKSPPMKELMEMVSMVVPSDATVLITGESGTGKELIGRAIYYKLPEQTEGVKGASCRQTEGQYFWMRSGKCLRPCRQNCYESFRKKRDTAGWK